jgi:hypothetical protein
MTSLALDHRARFHIAGAQQQPAEMCPEETPQRRMPIIPFISIMVAATVDGDPQHRRELQGARPKEGERPLEPERAGEATVRDEPEEAGVAAKCAKQEDAGVEK